MNTKLRNILFVCLLVVGIGITASYLTKRTADTNAATRPNILIVFADDMRQDDMQFMAKTKRLIGDLGTTYENMFSNNPLCCPARATLLTAQYTHNNGVLSNRAEDAGGYTRFDTQRNLNVTLKNNGYNTAYFGKYMNEYPQGKNYTEVPPGWTHWEASVKSIYDYNRVTLNTNGALKDYTGYKTDVFADLSSKMITNLAARPKPFFAMVSHNAPHTQRVNGAWVAPTPAARHQGTLKGKISPSKSAAHNEADMSDKPSWIRNLPPLSAETQARVLKDRQLRAESLLSLDDAVAKNLRALEATGELNNTIVVFTSDNGYMLGEHRLPEGKIVGYEESVRVPLLVRGPGFAPGVVVREAVGHVDLASTVATEAGVVAKMPYGIDGESIRAITPNRPILFEAGPRLTGGVRVPGEQRSYVAVRTSQYVLLRYWTGEYEMYDLAKDPWQISSVHSSPEYEATKTQLIEALNRLENCKGVECNAPLSPPTL